MALGMAIDIFLYGLLLVLFMVFFGIPSIEKYMRKDTIFVTSQDSTNNGIEAPGVSIIALNISTGYGWKSSTNQTNSGMLARYSTTFILDHCREINQTDLEKCIAVDSFDLTEFMTTATYGLSQTSVGKLNKTSWTMHVGQTPDGKVFTWNPQRVITPHRDHIMFLSLYKNFTYFIFVHDIDFYIISTNRLGATKAFWEFNENTMQSHYQEIALVKHKRLNLDHQPCEEDENYRMIECVKESFAKQVGCRLPWDKTTKHDRRVCSKREQFKQFEDMFVTITTDEIDQVKNMTNCLTPCSYKEYKFLTSIPKTLFIPIVPDDQIGIGLWGVSRSTEIKEEVFLTTKFFFLP